MPCIHDHVYSNDVLLRHVLIEHTQGQQTLSIYMLQKCIVNTTVGTSKFHIAAVAKIDNLVDTNKTSSLIDTNKAPSLEIVSPKTV